MVFISMTRVRIRSVRFIPGFLIHTARTAWQARRSGGYLGGSMLADRKLAFWTMTAWQDEGAMRRFMTGGAHRAAMPRLMAWCDEASVAHWTQGGADLPGWQDADRRMRAEGRASKVHRPSPDHAERAYRAPRTTTSVPLPAARG